MLANIQAVIFDLDGTLLDRRRSFERFVRDQWKRLADLVRTVDQEKYVQILIERDRDGYAPRNQLFTGSIAQFEVPPGLAGTLLDDYRAGFPSACVLFPDAAQTLSVLRAAGLKLGLITNGSVRMQSRNHPDVDVAGARAAGMQAVWRRDPRVSRVVEADAVIEALGDLVSLLGLERSGSAN